MLVCLCTGKIPENARTLTGNPIALFGKILDIYPGGISLPAPSFRPVMFVHTLVIEHEAPDVRLRTRLASPENVKDAERNALNHLESLCYGNIVHAW